MMNFAFPYTLDARGRTREAEEDDHIRHLIEQLLFTLPGERLHRPDFGSGLHTLLFAGENPHLLVATQTLVHAGLQKWLGSLIQVESVVIGVDEEVLTVDVTYTVIRQQRKAVVSLSKGVSA